MKSGMNAVPLLNILIAGLEKICWMNLRNCENWCEGG